MLGGAICLLLFFGGMGLSYFILSIDDNYKKSVFLMIHSAIHLILMILAVIFTFIDQKRMLEKGSISMDDTERAKKYTPLITREEASTEETHKFLSHIFKGKASLLVNHLVDSGDLSEEDLQQILDVMKDKKK